MSSGAVTTMLLKRKHGRTIHKLDRRARELRDALADKCRPFAEELQQAETERDATLDVLRRANYIIAQLPDATERKAVAAMSLIGRLRWALGVAWTGQFRWQREDERTT